MFGEELDFPVLSQATPLLSTLESSGYQQMVIQSLAKSAHPLLCSFKVSDMCPCTLSLPYSLFWLWSWGAKLASCGEFPCVNVHILQGFSLTFFYCVSEYMVSTALRTVKFSIYPQARKRHRSLQCKITSGFDSDLEEQWNEKI